MVVGGSGGGAHRRLRKRGVVSSVGRESRFHPSCSSYHPFHPSSISYYTQTMNFVVIIRTYLMAQDLRQVRSVWYYLARSRRFSIGRTSHITD